jgi:hypothetical protein
VSKQYKVWVIVEEETGDGESFRDLDQDLVFTSSSKRKAEELGADLSGFGLLRSGGFKPDEQAKRHVVSGTFEPDREILKKIHEQLDGKEWSADTLQEIASILTVNGFTIREPKR